VLKTNPFLKLRRADVRDRAEVAVEGRGAHVCLLRELLDAEVLREVGTDPADGAADPREAAVRRPDLAHRGPLHADDERSQVGLEALSCANWVHALSYLPLLQRVALELTYHLGHSREEIAAIMRCSAASVQRDVSSARRNLYTLLATSPRVNKAEVLPLL